MVAANTVDEANEFIRQYVKSDLHNVGDSWGYSEVDDSDLIEGVYSVTEGIVDHGIYYYG